MKIRTMAIGIGAAALGLLMGGLLMGRASRAAVWSTAAGLRRGAAVGPALRLQVHH